MSANPELLEGGEDGPADGGPPAGGALGNLGNLGAGGAVDANGASVGGVEGIVVGNRGGAAGNKGLLGKDGRPLNNASLLHGPDGPQNSNALIKTARGDVVAAPFVGAAAGGNPTLLELELSMGDFVGPIISTTARRPKPAGGHMVIDVTTGRQVLQAAAIDESAASSRHARDSRETGEQKATRTDHHMVTSDGLRLDLTHTLADTSTHGASWVAHEVTARCRSCRALGDWCCHDSRGKLNMSWEREDLPRS